MNPPRPAFGHATSLTTAQRRQLAHTAKLYRPHWSWSRIAHALDVNAATIRMALQAFPDA